MTVAGTRYAYQTARWDDPLSFGVQAFIEYNGYVINDRYQADRIRVMNITGLDDPEISDSRESLPGDHGETAYDAWYRGRTLVLSGDIEAGSLASCKRLERDLKAAFAPLVEVPLKFRWFDVYDSFDDPQTLANYTTAIGSTTGLTVSGGMLRWGTTTPTILLRSADNRLWGDSQQTIRMSVRATQDGSSIYLIPKYKDANNYIICAYTLTPATIQQIRNPSFEYDAIGATPAWWTQITSGAPTITTYAVQSGWAASGKQSMRITGTLPNGARLGINSATSGASAVAVTGSTAYSLAAQINAILSPSTTHVQMFVNWYTSGAAFISTSSVAQSTGTGITKLSLTGIVSPSNAAFAQVIIQQANDTGITQTVDCFVDAVQFTQTATVPIYFDADVGGQANGTPGNSTSTAQPTISISSVIGGVTIPLVSAVVTNVAITSTQRWLRSRIEGDLVTVELWNTQPVQDTSPAFSASTYLAGSDGDTLGDQTLSQVGFGASAANVFWVFSDFRVESLYPGDVAFAARKLSPLSIKDSQDATSRFKRTFQITMRASKHLALGATQSRSRKLVLANVVAPTLGFTFSLRFPFTFNRYIIGGQSPASNVLSIQNRGTAPTKGKLFVYGAISNFVLVNLTNGQQIAWTGTLTDGDWLVIDNAARTIVNSLGVNQMAFATPPPQWIWFEPGWNDLYISGSLYSAKTQLLAFSNGGWM